MPRHKQQVFDVKETKKKIDLPPLSPDEGVKLRNIRALLFEIFDRFKLGKRKTLPELSPGQYRVVRAALDIYAQVSREVHENAGRIEISIKEASIEDLKAVHRMHQTQEIQGEDIQVVEDKKENGGEGVARAENGTPDRVFQIGHKTRNGARRVRKTVQAEKTPG